MALTSRDRGGGGGGWCCGRRSCVPLVSVWLCALFTLLACSRSVHSSMDITAFEYFRKFGRHLELGECPLREILITRPDNSTVLKSEPCKARQQGNITNVARELNDTRHVIIPTANDLVAYLGLCGGQAASYLGILNNAGDCVAVEIASQLSFNKKTMVRAYVEYYRKSLDILDSPTSAPGIRDGLTQYVADKFYVKNRSYGTLEIILVQFRFRSRRQTELARDLKVTSPLMSEYMKKVEREVGKPRKVLVLSLSTATEDTYRLNKFDELHWGAAVRDVELREVTVNQTRALIDSGRVRPHLNYQLFPFVARNVHSYRLSSPLTWEATSMLEVSLRVSYSIAKKSAKRCRKNRSLLCRRVRELRRKLKAAQGEIHKGRSNWMEFSAQEQQEFAQRYTARVATFTNVTKKLSRDVRAMHKQRQASKAKAKAAKATGRMQRRRNQVPLDSRIRRVKYKAYRAHPHRLRRRQ